MADLRSDVAEVLHIRRLWSTMGPRDLAVLRHPQAIEVLKQRGHDADDARMELERALACAGGRIERSPGRPEVGRDEVRGSENWWWPVRTLPLQL